jgi:hypothetical protein
VGIQTVIIILEISAELQLLKRGKPRGLVIKERISVIKDGGGSLEGEASRKFVKSCLGEKFSLI